MIVRRLRWWLALLLGLLSLLLPACSETQAQTAPKVTRRRERPAAPKPAEPAKPTPKSVAPVGQERRHPFSPARDTGARRSFAAGRLGKLVLKGICGTASQPTAIIQEGKEAHFVHVGEQIGGLVVLSIHDGEVVLGAGRHKRVLTLYDGSGHQGSRGTGP